jgi:hypothetical protein
MVNLFLLRDNIIGTDNYILYKYGMKMLSKYTIYIVWQSNLFLKVIFKKIQQLVCALQLMQII